MCGYCCGSTPVEKRGEGHKNCSEECFNAPRPKRRSQSVAGAGEGLVEAVRALADECSEVVELPTPQEWDRGWRSAHMKIEHRLRALLGGEGGVRG